MAEVSPGQEVRFELRLDNPEMADELKGFLEEQGASDVVEERMLGILPGLGIVIVGVIAAAGIAQVANYVHRTWGCQQTIDARHNPVKQTIDCKVRNGTVVTISENGTVALTDVPDLIDITEVIKAALSTGKNVAEAVKKAAEDLGAKAEIFGGSAT